MEEVLFLFSYHRLDDVTRRHYARLGQLHPCNLIVPLTHRYQGGESLPDTVDVAGDVDHGWPILNPWTDRDKVYLRWFLRAKRPQARRYVFFEYDVFANAPAETFYGAAWDAEVAAARVVVPQDAPRWPWWRQAVSLEDAMPLRTGLSPIAASLWSHEALTRITRQPRFLPCFAELRLGTLARAVGLTPVEIPGAKATIGWRPEQDPTGGQTTWFHPIKHLR
jgi:hypothetical protein